MAVSTGNINVTKLLIDAKANIHARDCFGKTPLHYSAKFDNLDLFRLLLDAGADFNVMDKPGQCVMHLAIKSNNIELVKLLIKEGADINACEEHGITPLMLAVKFKYQKIFDLLIHAGVDVNGRGKYRGTALHHAAKSKQNINFLKILIDSGAEVNVTSEDGKTPLHHAALTADVNIVKQLMDAGASLNNVDGNGNTPLTIILQKCYLDKKEKIIRKMMEFTDVNLNNEKGTNILSDFLQFNCVYPKLKVFHKVIIEHIAILHSMDYKLNPTLLKTLNEESKSSIYYRLIANESESDDEDDFIKIEYKFYFQSCLSELKKSKRIRVRNCWITFFDLLVNSIYNLIKCAGNKDLIDDVGETIYEGKFPIYGPAIESKVSKGIYGRKLYDRAACMLCYYLPIFDPTHLIIGDTLDILDIKNWEDLCDNKRCRE